MTHEIKMQSEARSIAGECKDEAFAQDIVIGGGLISVLRAALPRHTHEDAHHYGQTNLIQRKDGNEHQASNCKDLVIPYPSCQRNISNPFLIIAVRCKMR